MSVYQRTEGMPSCMHIDGNLPYLLPLGEGTLKAVHILQYSRRYKSQYSCNLVLRYI
jgi:hypothetical protein